MATSNAATNYLERRLLHFLFKNYSLSFSSPGDSIYVGLATAVSAAETGSLTEASFGGYLGQQVTAANWTTIGADSTDTQTAKDTVRLSFPQRQTVATSQLLMYLLQTQVQVVTYCL